MAQAQRNSIVWIAAILTTTIACNANEPAVNKTPPAAPAIEPPENEPEPKATAQDVEREAREAFDTTSQYAQQSAAELRRQLQEQIDALEPEIERLKAQGKDLKEQAKPEWNRRMAQLEEKRQAAQRKLEAWKSASPEAWKELKSGATQAWQDLKQSLDEAKRRLDEAEAAPSNEGDKPAPK